MTIRLIDGDSAPPFTLPDADGKNVSLADFPGQRVIVYFYPAAMTPGCTTQAVDFTAAMEELGAAGLHVIGISPDAQEKLIQVPRKESVGFPLLSDPDKSTLDAYGAYGEKLLYGKLIQGSDPIDLRDRRRPEGERHDRGRSVQREGDRPRRQAQARPSSVKTFICKLRIALRRAEEERRDMLFVPERRRSRRVQRDPHPRCSRRRSAGGANETRRDRADCPAESFRRSRRRRRLPGERRSERSEPLDHSELGERGNQIERAWRARQSNTAGVVELVDTQDLGSCAFGCEGSSPSFGTVSNWLRANSNAASDPARYPAAVRQSAMTLPPARGSGRLRHRRSELR